MRFHRMTSQIGPLLMLGAGLGFAIAAVATLDLGSARRMGPGAFPLLVGATLALLAAITLVRNLRAPMDWQRPDPLAVLAVLGGVVAFAFFTPLLGVLPAAVLSVLATSAVVPEFRWPWKFALAFSVAAGVWLVFVVGLGIPLTAIRGF